MKRTITLTTAVTVAALALIRCDSTVINHREHPVPEYKSPATVLKAVQISFNQRNIDYLKKSLSPDFVFYFDPRDVGASPPGKPGYKIPESWSYAEFTEAANRMLHTAYSISLFVPVGPLREPGENETTYKAENVTISLLVMVDEVDGFMIDKGFCDFAFEAYYNEQKEKRWRLTGWWDHTSGGYDESAEVAPASLGKLLALYYRE